MKLSERDTSIVQLGWPALITALIVPSYTLADTAIVGRRLGTVSLGGLALASAVLTVAFTVFNFLQWATTSRVAFLTGRKDPAGAAGYAAQGLWLSVGIGIPVALLLTLGAGPLTTMMGGKGKVQHAAITYLHIGGWGMPLVLIALVGNAYFRGLSDMKTPLWIVGASNVLNVVLEILFVYVFHWGISGSAAGTLIAQALAAGWLFALMARNFARSGAGLRPIRSEMAELMKVARYLVVRTAALNAAPAIATAVAAHVNTTTLDAQQICYQVWIFLAVLFSGLSVPAQSIVGTLLGEGRDEEARAYAHRMLVIGSWLGVFVGGAVLATSFVVPRIFSTNPAVIHAGTEGLLIAGLLQVPNASLWVLDGVLMGAGEYRFMQYSTVGGLVAFLPVALVVLHWHSLGIVGLWVGMGIWAIGRMSVNAYRYLHRDWSSTTELAVATTG